VAGSRKCGNEPWVSGGWELVMTVTEQYVPITNRNKVLHKLHYSRYQSDQIKGRNTGVARCTHGSH
jgi:hypothetical protein